MKIITPKAELLNAPSYADRAVLYLLQDRERRTKKGT